MSTMVSPCMHSSPGLDADALQQSSPLSLRQSSTPPISNSLHPHDYNFSGAVYDEPTPTAEPAESDVDELPHTKERVFSATSSISSFPASISQYAPSAQFPTQHVTPPAPSHRGSSGPSYFDEPTNHTNHEHLANSPQSLRDHPSPFRHPSSVRAIQMKDEAMSDTQSVLRHHRRSGSQMSFYSQRTSFSAHTSPTKRSSRSHRSSPSKSGSHLKKEFPLVLLHCTLLPPCLRTQHASIEDSLMVDLLPEQYKERWVILRNKLADVEVSSRGVLVSHPREDYALLEERLLESLELEAPRIRHNHYFPSGASTADSGFESASTEDEAEPETSGFSDVKCPDCGHRLHKEEVERKWEVKVFAANGLMRAGAWAAAWQEMEKVDVEVNVWLPENVRQELEEKLALLEAPPFESAELEPQTTWSAPEPYRSRDEEVYGVSGNPEYEFHPSGVNGQHLSQSKPEGPVLRPHLPARHDQGGWGWLTLDTRHLFSDIRNVLLAVVSLLVLYFAWIGRNKFPPTIAQPSMTSMSPSAVEFTTSTVVTTSVAVSTTTLTEFNIAEVTEVAQVLADAVDTTVAADDFVSSLEMLIDTPPASRATDAHDGMVPQIGTEPVHVEHSTG